MRILREYIKSVLKESSPADDLAAGVFEDESSGGLVGVIYDASVERNIDQMRDILSMGGAGQKLRAFLAQDFIRGFIVVGPPPAGSSSCNDAWMVYRSAGHDYGREVYGLGYALSPSGRLMPDRSSVSTSAQRGWARQFEKGRSSIQLDDKQHRHDIEGNEYHTEDPSDDCDVYTADDDDNEDFVVPLDILNRTYEESGRDAARADMMTARHKIVVKNIPQDISAQFLRELKLGGRIFFSKAYRAELNAEG